MTHLLGHFKLGQFQAFGVVEWRRSRAYVTGCSPGHGFLRDRRRDPGDGGRREQATKIGHYQDVRECSIMKSRP